MQTAGTDGRSQNDRVAILQPTLHPSMPAQLSRKNFHNTLSSYADLLQHQKSWLSVIADLQPLI